MGEKAGSLRGAEAPDILEVPKETATRHEDKK
jgi:hypothetical protein